jgi:hypothetical protein
MTDEDRPDVRRLRHHLYWLVAAIVVVGGGILWLTLHLYERWTAGVTVTP